MASSFCYIQLPLQHRKIKTELETLNGKTLQRVESYIAQGWPKSENQSNPELKPYYSLRDELITVYYSPERQQNSLTQYTYKRNETKPTYWPPRYLGIK